MACFVYLGCIDPSLHVIAELQISHHFWWNKLNVVALNLGRITRRKGNCAWPETRNSEQDYCIVNMAVGTTILTRSKMRLC